MLSVYHVILDNFIVTLGQEHVPFNLSSSSDFIYFTGIISLALNALSQSTIYTTELKYVVFSIRKILNELIRDNFLRSTSIDEIGKDILIRTGQTIQVKLCWEWTYLTKQNKNAHWILFSKIVCDTSFDSRPHLPNWRNISQCVASLGMDAYGKKLN